MGDVANRQDILDGLKQSSEIEIAVTGRRTGKRFSAPVWFVLNGREVVLVPVHGSETEWFKNVAKDPRIELTVRGIAIQSKAKVVKDPKEVELLLDKFRAKYKSEWSESYYDKRDVYLEVPV